MFGLATTGNFAMILSRFRLLLHLLILNQIFRGNTYSRGHCDLKPNDKAFWEFRYLVTDTPHVKFKHIYVHFHDLFINSIVTLVGMKWANMISLP